MDVYFDTSGLSAEKVNSIQHILNELNHRFGIEVTGYIDFQLQGFGVFGHYTSIRVRDSFVIRHKHDSCYLLIVETFIKTTTHKGMPIELRELQLWALAYMKYDMGKVLIRHETLKDKLIELIFPVELDFKEDKPFSDAFYVVADDTQKAINGMDWHFRNAVMDISDNDEAVIEINGTTLIISDRKPISVDGAVKLAAFITKLINR